MLSLSYALGSGYVVCYGEVPVAGNAYMEYFVVLSFTVRLSACTRLVMVGWVLVNDSACTVCCEPFVSDSVYM